MWLLHTSTKKLEGFLGRIPKYAILSHTWRDEEVSFQDVMLNQASTKKGWTKIERCCQQALGDGYTWVWVDTCCIDKTSSAELSEAINSMFKWYQEAGVCYAYLDDVYDLPEAYPPDFEYPLTHSRWFSRGWTLQELIAPQEVLFFTEMWKKIGTRKLLAEQISRITGISLGLLLEQRSLYSYSIAQRLSWAAKRQTTRREDQAYSLLGIFDVNMPLLYGEGDKAFGRLQDQIIQNAKELSFLVWKDKPHASGILASSLETFAECGGVVLSDIVHYHPLPRNIMKSNFYFSMTVRVLSRRTKYHTRQSDEDGPEETLVALLGCRYENEVDRVIGLQLDALSMSAKEALATTGPLYCTVHASWTERRLAFVDVLEAAQSADYRDVFVLERDTTNVSRSMRDIRWTNVSVRLVDSDAFRFEVVSAWPKSCWTNRLSLDLLDSRVYKAGGSQFDPTGLWLGYAAGSIIISIVKLQGSVVYKYAKVCFRRFTRYGLRFQYALQTIQDVDRVNHDTDEANCDPRTEAGLKWIDADDDNGPDSCSLRWPDGNTLIVEMKRVLLTDIDVACFNVRVEPANVNVVAGPAADEILPEF